MDQEERDISLLRTLARIVLAGLAAVITAEAVSLKKGNNADK